MDGLLIAEPLALLSRLVPSGRGAWRFPDDRSVQLRLHSGAVVTVSAHHDDPRLEVLVDGGDAPRGDDGAGRAASRPRTPFQAQLAARATGDLVAVEQHALDRVVRLSFGEGTGFVPEKPIDLIVELTGRNANLILVDEAGTIVGTQRTVHAGQNRHREVRAGVRYEYPPPYVKLDPRGAGEDVLRRTLAGRPLRDVRSVIDGVGPQLYRVVVALARSRDDSAPLEGDDLERAVAALQEVVARPSAALDAVTGLRRSEAASDAHGGGRADAATASLARRLAKRRQVAAKRVADAHLAIAAANDAQSIREEADLLLASVGSFLPDGDVVELVGFDGERVRLTIDPALDAAGNAAQRYARARRREARAENARRRLPELDGDLQAVEEKVAALAGADEATLGSIEHWLDEVEPPGVEPQDRHAAKQRPKLPGVRFVDPRGYEVLVGRSAKENEAITFKVAKSRDVWLHVQGYQGSHVIVRSQGREVPFDTVLFAARLAAGYSKAKQSDSVPVDYTQRKNVWRVKGGAPGAVHMAHQKTVYVTPSRDGSDSGAPG